MDAFIVTPFVKYKDFNECARKHMLSSWHKGALQDNLFPILSSILFCCSHNIALKGKERTQWNFCHLLLLRIEAGDTILKDHMEGASKNARYTSVRVQNELIVLSEEVVRDNIVKAANESNGPFMSRTWIP